MLHNILEVFAKNLPSENCFSEIKGINILKKGNLEILLIFWFLKNLPSAAILSVYCTRRTMGIWPAFRSMRRDIHIQHYGFHVRPPPAHLFPKHMDLEQWAISYVTPPLLFNCFDHIHYANILSLSSCTSVTTQLWGSSGLNIDPPQFGLYVFGCFWGARIQRHEHKHLVISESLDRKGSVRKWWPRRYQHQWNH